MPRLSQILAGYGRRGDTMLAHINPQEAQLLKRRGGSGTINPATGLTEFFTSSKGDREHGGAFGGGAAGGSERGGGSGSVDKGGVVGGSVRGGRAYGGALGGGVRGRSSGMGSDPMGGKSAGVGKSLAGVIGGGPVSENAAMGMTATGSPGLSVGWGDVLGGLGSIIGGVIGGPLGGVALGGAGTLAGEAMGDVGTIGGTSVTEARDRGYAGTGANVSSGGSLSRAEGPGSGTTATRRRGQRPDRPTPAPNTPALPEIPELPSWLGGIGQGMSPLQIRSFIATQGSQGLDSAYRDMATLDYYRKLLKSTVGNYAQILPVEHRYLQDVYGFQYQPTLQDLYRIIGG